MVQNFADLGGIGADANARHGDQEGSSNVSDPNPVSEVLSRGDSPSRLRARAIRFSTLDAICEALSCQPGDILRFEPEQAERQRPAAAGKRSASR